MAGKTTEERIAAIDEKIAIASDKKGRKPRGDMI